MYKCYSKEMLTELGKIYGELLKILNTQEKDPCRNMVDTFPIKCFMLNYKKALHIGIPKALEKKIGEYMDKITAENFSSCMETPVPINLRQYFTLGLLS